MKKKTVKLAALTAVIVGGLNWGLLGFFNYDLIVQLFGFSARLIALIYDLIGLGALWLVFDRPRT